MTTSGLSILSYLQQVKLDTLDEQLYNQKAEELLSFNRTTHAGNLLTPLSYYLSILDKHDEVMLAYMPLDKRDVLLKELQITYLILLAEQKYELVHEEMDTSTLISDKLKKCQQLIDALNYKKACAEMEMQPSPEHGYETEGKPVKYLSFFLGQWLALKIMDLVDHKTKSIKEAMDWFNEKRLSWVWGSGMLKPIFGALPSDFFNIQQAKATVRTPDPFMNVIGWSLYYLRFSLNLYLLLKHTIKGPWMSKEEADMPWSERFQTQWNQRKFALLNDFFEGTASLASFLWLTGKGVAGAWGSTLSIGLIGYEIGLMLWDYTEHETKFNKDMLGFSEEIAKETTLIKNLNESSLDEDEKNRQLLTHNMRLTGLNRAKKQCQRDWDFQVSNLKTGLAYALGIMMVFTLLSTAFLPITGPALGAILVTGAVLNFALSVIYKSVQGKLDIHKSQELCLDANDDYQTKLSEFHELAKNPATYEGDKKFLFLELKKIKAETENQKQMITFKSMHLFQSIIMETLMPSMVFVSLVFLPLGIGFAALGATLALAVLSNALVNKIFEPKKEAQMGFDEQEYAAFCKENEHLKEPKLNSDQRFFKAELNASIKGAAEKDNVPLLELKNR
jgi:hypothetical protein